MALVGTDGRFLRVNRSLCEILGFPEKELLRKTFQEITHPDDLEVDVEHLRRLLAGEIRTYQTEKRYHHQDGHEVWALLSVSVVHDEQGEPLYFVSQIQDVSERKVLEERLIHQAFHDPLTGLANRHLLVNRLAHALDRTRRRRDRQAVVLFMDLDGFKVVNDSLGHEVGDHLLVLVAERLRRSMRPEDTLARFGGDEFVVLLEDVEDPSEAVRVAKRIANELKKPFVMDGRSLFTSFSIGIAQGNARTKSPLDLLRDADTAMYRAKSEHDDHRIFDPAMYKQAMKRLELENDLRRGVENQEFFAHYQTIVDLETGETWGMEALLRWEHPERGLLEASEFMAILEESGLAVPAGERVLEEACWQALRWQEQRPLTPPLVVSVNLSAVQLERPNLARIGAEVLGKTGLDPRRLSLDVTETAYIRILEERIATLDRLKELGVGVAIDDFGVGYSSLSYLKRLPADILKIDRSFVRGVGEVEEDTSIVRMVIDLAHTLGMKVVAEGIEEWEQAALLAEMGCDLGQGFYFSRPLSPEAVPEFLAG
jgi:diguanylate cyclase (GGDEF)-like protein/PAS domain S-box-containing protein